MKSTVEVWRVMDIEKLPNTEMEIGTFPKIKEFALDLYDSVEEGKYKREYIENGDETIIFAYLDEHNFEVQHVCDVSIDEFKVKRIDYTTDI